MRKVSTSNLYTQTAVTVRTGLNNRKQIVIVYNYLCNYTCAAYRHLDCLRLRRAKRLKSCDVE